MKILVTGGSGFLGSHIADELSRCGHEVIILDKRKSKWIRKDQKIIDSIILSDPNLHPDVIMVDIEEKIHSIKDSKIVKTLENNNYILTQSILEKGSKEIPNSYKTIFRKK